MSTAVSTAAAGASAAVAAELEMEKDAFRGLLRYALMESGKSAAQVAAETGGVIKRSTAYNYAKPTYTGFPDSAERVEAFLKACKFENVELAVQTWKDIKRKQSTPPAALADPAGLGHILIQPPTTSSELPDTDRSPRQPDFNLSFYELPRPVTTPNRSDRVVDDDLLPQTDRDELDEAPTVPLPRLRPRSATRTRPASVEEDVSRSGGGRIAGLFSVLASALTVIVMADLLDAPVEVVLAAAELPWVLLTACVVMATAAGALVVRGGERPGAGSVWSRPWTTRGVLVIAATVPAAVCVVGLLGEREAAIGPVIGLVVVLLASQWYATVDLSRLGDVAGRSGGLCALVECMVVGALFGFGLRMIQFGQGLPVIGVVCIGLVVLVALLHLLATTSEAPSNPVNLTARQRAEIRSAVKPTRHRRQRSRRRTRRIEPILARIGAVVILHQHSKFQPRAEAKNIRPRTSYPWSAEAPVSEHAGLFNAFGDRFPRGSQGLIDSAAYPADRFNLAELLPCTLSRRAAKTTASRLALAAALTMTGRSWNSTGQHLVRWAYNKAGVLLPPTSFQQSLVGEPVCFDGLEPGDIVITERDSGLYAGDGRILMVAPPAPGLPPQVRLVRLSPSMMIAALRFFLPDHRPLPIFFPESQPSPFSRVHTTTVGTASWPSAAAAAPPRGSGPAGNSQWKTAPRPAGPPPVQQHPASIPPAVRTRRLWPGRARRRAGSADGRQVSVHELLTRSLRPQQPFPPAAPPTAACQPDPSWAQQHTAAVVPPNSSLLQPITPESKAAPPAWSVRRWRRD
ncbi:hypothetical protein [Nocardia gipuzkoensis]